MTFFGASLALGSALELLLQLIVLYKIHFPLHVTIQSRNGSSLLHRIREDDTSKWQLFDFQSAHKAPTYQAFSPFQFASNVEWWKNSWHWILWQLFNCKRISFDDGSQLVGINFWRPATALVTFKALISFAKLLEPPLHCMFISSSWAKWLLMLQIASAALQPILNSNKKTARICFLSNIISLV